MSGQVHKLDVHFKSQKHDWETPDWLFSMLDKQLGFDLDVCASPVNAKCNSYFTEHFDAMRNDCLWSRHGISIWMNPPYGRSIGTWIHKAYLESLNDFVSVVCLIPARTDTIWWHEYVMKAWKVWFIKGRIKFVGAKEGAPFPSCVVRFTGKACSTRPTFGVIEKNKPFVL